MFCPSKHEFFCKYHKREFDFTLITRGRSNRSFKKNSYHLVMPAIFPRLLVSCDAREVVTKYCKMMQIYNKMESLPFLACDMQIQHINDTSKLKCLQQQFGRKKLYKLPDMTVNLAIPMLTN